METSPLACLPYAIDQQAVCLLVQIGNYRLLLDCGLRETEVLAGCGADAVLCSHAHSDHCRGLWQLHQTFPHLPVYASEVTTQLLPLHWPEGGSDFCRALPWRSPVEILDGLVVQLFPAGHIPGAALICLTYKNYTLVYTGDFFLSHSRLVEGLDIQAVRGLQPEVLIVEGSYGTQQHPHRRHQENRLVEQILLHLQRGKSLLLPVPKLGMGQEILMLLRSHHLFTGRNVDIWVDEPVAVGCDAYLEILPHLPIAVQNFARHQSLFWDERILPKVRRWRDQLPTQAAPSIVLVEHRRDFSLPSLGDPDQWVLLLPLHTPVTHMANRFPTETYLLDQHSDRQGTTQLIHNLRPRHLIFVHGNRQYLNDLACLDDLQSRYQIHLPQIGQWLDLPVSESFMANPKYTTNYPGELQESDTSVVISFPEAITADPRWANFADTGVVEARWQGEELVLRGIKARELMQQAYSRNLHNSSCCAKCRYQIKQHCTNVSSSMAGLRVSPEGYCQEFAP
jgi:Cft2 family RNA processing exonuclease